MFDFIDAHLINFVGPEEKARLIILRFSGLQAVTGSPGHCPLTFSPVCRGKMLNSNC